MKYQRKDYGPESIAGGDEYPQTILDQPKGHLA
jgi:hypothetical protein